MYKFEFFKPVDLHEAERLVATNAEYKFLAGGMSLVPSLKMRLSKVAGLVDLGDIDSLKGIRLEDNNLIIGAMTSHETVASSELVKKAIPALSWLAGGIGDPMVRNRGTIGGSLANADPAADYPAGVLGLKASVITNKREINADDFFVGLYQTALYSEEIITAIRFPIPECAGYVKLRNPASRFAVIAIMVAKTFDGVRVALTGAGSHVYRISEAEAILTKNFSPTALNSFYIPSEELNSDIHASAEYRAHCFKSIASRAISISLSETGNKKLS